MSHRCLGRTGLTLTALSTALLLAGPWPVFAADDPHAHHHHHQAAPASNMWDEAPVKVPDVTLVDQDGRKVRLYSDLVKGRTVAINFIYTSCTTVCSPLTATFRQVQKDVVARGGDKVELISISVDPLTDTPAVMKQFSQRFEAGPHWTFLTGKPADIERVLKSFGVPIVKKEEHTPLIFVSNEPTGKWTRTFGLASVKSIADTVAEAAGLTKVAQPEPAAAPAAPAGEHDHHHHHHHDHKS